MSASVTKKLAGPIGQQIRTLAKRGLSSRAIVSALGPGAPSRSTVDRFLRSAPEPIAGAPLEQRKHRPGEVCLGCWDLVDDVRALRAEVAALKVQMSK